jgi:hypothetical protein
MNNDTSSIIKNTWLDVKGFIQNASANIATMEVYISLQPKVVSSDFLKAENEKKIKDTIVQFENAIAILKGNGAKEVPLESVMQLLGEGVFIANVPTLTTKNN